MTTPPTRRSILAGLVGLGTTGLLGCAGSAPRTPAGVARPWADPSPAGAGTGPLLPPGRVDPRATGRLLVLVELDGGNDGLSTVVPAASGRYHDLRPTTAVTADEVLALDDEVGLHPALERLHRRGVAVVEGVGPLDGDLSHFAMADRWRRGDVDGTAGWHTGFAGRLVDALDDDEPEPFRGLSVAGATPHLIAERATPMALHGLGSLWMFRPTDSPAIAAFQEAFAELAHVDPAPASLLAAGRALGPDDGTGDHPDLVETLAAEGGDLGAQLGTLAALLAAGIVPSVAVASLGGFDTHTGHRGTHDDLMRRVDASVGGFLDVVDDLGLADAVVVATVSEFGRRVPENDSGLDHGSASTMLVAGAVEPGRYGEPSSLDALDEDDNLVPTVGFDRYLASLAEEWLGVEAAGVLTGAPTPLGLWS